MRSRSTLDYSVITNKTLDYFLIGYQTCFDKQSVVLLPCLGKNLAFFFVVDFHVLSIKPTYMNRYKSSAIFIYFHPQLPFFFFILLLQLIFITKKILASKEEPTVFIRLTSIITSSSSSPSPFKASNPFNDNTPIFDIHYPKKPKKAFPIFTTSFCFFNCGVFFISLFFCSTSFPLPPILSPPHAIRFLAFSCIYTHRLLAVASIQFIKSSTEEGAFTSIANTSEA